MNVHYECGHVEFGSGSESVYIERVCDFCIAELIDPTDDELVSELGMLEDNGLDQAHAEYYENLKVMPDGSPVILFTHPGPDCGCVDCDGPYQPAPKEMIN